MLPVFWNYSIKSASQKLLIFRIFDINKLKNTGFFFLILVPLFTEAQQKDTFKVKTDTAQKPQAQAVTHISGQVTDAVTGIPLPFIIIRVNGSTYGTTSNQEGKFDLNAPGSHSRVTFSYVGYQSVVKIINPAQNNELQVRMQASRTQLKEVSVTAGKKKKYKNKGNPAVELIQQIIDHKDQNRMKSSDYIQYDQYERIALTLVDPPKLLTNNRVFSKFKFMFDTTQTDGQKHISVPVFFSEKLSQNYYRKEPSKSIQILNAKKEVNIIKFIDTVGLDTYLNRLYGNNIDLYTNNIFILSNQFLSPIADHAPDFYKFFITDTIQVGKDKLVEVSFTPRNKGDLLFEGKLAVTLDGRYAVESCELNVNKQINVNFIRSFKVKLDFKKHDDDRYYLTKSDAKADFGILKNKGFGVSGERSVFYSNYILNTPLVEAFYEGKSLQTSANVNKPDTSYWAHNRVDTLSAKQQEMFAKVNRLESMRSFKTLTWLASTLTGGFANLGKVQIGPVGTIYSYNSQEGSRLQLGGRTTPKFNETVYLEGFAGYGFRDKKLKYNLSTYFSLNKTPYYRFPNDYFKVSYEYDINVPGQNYALNNSQRDISTFYTGKVDYWLYNKTFKIDYVKDLESHFSYNFTFKNWTQQAAGTLVYQYNDQSNRIVNNLTTTELDFGLRYAPHEQLLQGTMYRRTIYSKYPIFTLQVNHGFKGVLNSSYNYNNITANIFKRFYLSQLGFTDITLKGALLTGKVPFPLLDISLANQSIAYSRDAYNQMTYLEFVSDHYVGLNITHNFNGFILNKIPLIEHLKWREFLSAKILYGGLRKENNPLYSQNLYRFPVAADGAAGTYALGSKPYVEGGVGIGNIFKILRVDVIKRFNYLDHPNISAYGVKISFSPDF